MRPGAIRAGTLCCVVIVAACAERESPLDAARRALDEGRSQEAYRLAGELTEGAGASSTDAWVLRARAALRTWRTGVGREAAERAVELAPDDPRGYRVLALAERRSAHLPEAIAAARTAVDLAPDDPATHVLLGEMLLGVKNVATPDYSAAEGAFRRAVALHPGDPRARFGLATALVTSLTVILGVVSAFRGGA